jgi:16S rRNA (cytidine1402-2'-O)-methyltransferase
VIARLAAGESVALVVDAGTPAFPIRGRGWWRGCVPPAIVSSRCLVPCAAVVALSAAGLGEAHFLCSMVFCRARPGSARGLAGTGASALWALVFYEAPHRILEAVAALAVAFGPERTLVLARELTKLFESIHCCTLGEAQAWLLADANRQRGEFVLLVSGAAPVEENTEGERVLQLLLDDGLSIRQASRLAHAITGVGKNALYQRALDLQGSGGWERTDDRSSS